MAPERRASATATVLLTDLVASTEFGFVSVERRAASLLGDL